MGDWLLLGVAAGYWPLAVMASHLVGIGHPERLVAIIGAVWLLAAAVAWVVIKAGGHRSTTIYATFLAFVVLMSGGRILRSFGEVIGWGAILGVVLLSGYVFYRLRDSSILRPAVLGIAFALMSGVVIALISSWQSWGEVTVSESPLSALQPEATPDIFVVVLDGYPGFEALRLDGRDVREDRTTALTEAGFDVPGSAWSSYWTTSMAVASMFNMAHPLSADQGGGADEARLYEIIGGQNPIVALLNDHGYETVMIESGWSGSSCTPAYDSCISSPFVDEGVFLALLDTVAGPYVHSSIGYSFTVGTEYTMDWLLENAAGLSASPTPDFVFAHLIVPHAPFFLNGSCRREVINARSGVNFYLSGVPESEREEYFDGQLDCADRFMVELAALIEPDDIVVFVGDHGTDRRSQQHLRGDEWDSAAVVERMNVFVAVRTGSSCSIGDELMLPNLMRRVLSCIWEVNSPEVANRMFLNGMVEVDPAEVDSLLAGS